MKFFLNLKHWHIFLLTIAIPTLVVILGATIVIKTIISSGSEFNPSMVIEQLKILATSLVFFQLIYFTLFLSLGLGFQNRLPYKIKNQKYAFIIALLIPTIVSIIMFTLLGEIYWDFIENMLNRDKNQSPELFLQKINSISKYTTPLNILSLASSAYAYYFIAKGLKSVEIRKEAQIGDFAIELVWFVFYFIGMWILQPRFNDIVKGKYDKKDEDFNLGKDDEGHFYPKLND